MGSSRPMLDSSSSSGSTSEYDHDSHRLDWQADASNNLHPFLSGALTLRVSGQLGGGYKSEVDDGAAC